jgi:hypothetical protein
LQMNFRSWSTTKFQEVARCVKTNGTYLISNFKKLFLTTTKALDVTHHIMNCLQRNMRVITYFNPSTKTIRMQLKHFKENTSSTNHYM